MASDIMFPSPNFEVKNIQAIVIDGLTFTNAEDATHHYAVTAASRMLQKQYQQVRAAGDLCTKIQFDWHRDYYERKDYKAADKEYQRLTLLYSQEHYKLSSNLYQNALPFAQAILRSKYQG